MRLQMVSERKLYSRCALVNDMCPGTYRNALLEVSSTTERRGKINILFLILNGLLLDEVSEDWNDNDHFSRRRTELSQLTPSDNSTMLCQMFPKVTTTSLDTSSTPLLGLPARFPMVSWPVRSSADHCVPAWTSRTEVRGALLQAHGQVLNQPRCLHTSYGAWTAPSTVPPASEDV